MFCPYCNYECEEQDRYCSHCGAPLTARLQEKKGRHWVPLLIMVLLISFGTGLFFALPSGTGDSHAGGFSTGDMPWFEVDDGVLYFNEAHYDGGSELCIPESIGGVAVTSLSEGCFENCTNLTSVILPPSLQTIGEDAFRGCTSLRGIEIPESVRVIGSGAFYGCSALEAVCGYDGIQSIGSEAFGSCSKLNYIYFVGNFEVWAGLYHEFITPYTVVFCEDGSFYQGGTPY